ncbi:hypothetical protein RhiirA4_484293, partial [Rhizophagus irregularis]
VYVGKKDIQFTPCERSTTDYPVTLISPSLDPHIDELFESSLSDNLSSRVVDHLSPLGNVVSYDNTSLIFVSDSDDDLMDSDDESSFLSFDEETFDYYEAEWVELISRPVCFPLTSIHIRFPSFGLDITEISSRLLFIPSPLPLLPPSFLDLRVAYGQRMFWKIFVHSSSLGAFLFVPPLLTADFKFYDRIFSLQPSIYDQITRFACLFEIFAGLLLFVRRILGFLHYSFICIFNFFFQQFLIAKMRYSFSADVLLSYLQSRVLSQFGVLLPAGFAGVVEQSSSEVWFWF